MNKILVTGVGGNVGQYIAHALHKEGYCVTGIYRNSVPKKAEYELVRADLSEGIPGLPDINVIIHIAAAVQGTVKKLVRDNIKTTENLIQYAEQENVKLFIYMSTVSVYGDVREELTEDSGIINPQSYGMTKFLAEQMVRESSVQAKLIIQLPRMLGPFADWKNPKNSGFLTMVNKLLRGEDVYCYIPDIKYNNYLHVADLAGFLRYFLGKTDRFDCEKILLGMQERLTMMEILQIMKDEAGSKSQIIAKNTGQIPLCALVNINKAKNMGFVSCSAEETLRKFIKEINSEK